VHFLQPLIETCEWFGQNFAHNLDFVPDDKLNWKPAPTAKSALEIAGEAKGLFRSIRALFSGEMMSHEAAFDVPTSREQAKTEILFESRAYADFLRGLTPADLEGELDAGFGPFPKSRLVQFPVYDIANHHGQITYL
jgi:hypothetical protein